MNIRGERLRHTANAAMNVPADRAAWPELLAATMAGRDAAELLQLGRAENEQVDGWNKELLRGFKRRFPEYSDVFAGLVARAHERGTTRGFGTVEELPGTSR